MKLKVANLRPMSRWFTLTVKVLKVGEERVVRSRRDEAEHRVAEALVGDETGTVLFSLWDDEIERIRGLEGSTIEVKNGMITLFRGSMRLSLGRFGSIEKAKEEITEVNESVNMSERRFEERGPPRGRPRMGPRRFESW